MTHFFFPEELNVAKLDSAQYMVKIEALEGELFLFIDGVQIRFNGPINSVLVIAKATREIEKKILQPLCTQAAR